MAKTTETAEKSTEQPAKLKPEEGTDDFLKASHEEEKEAISTDVAEFGGLFEDEPKATEDELKGVSDEPEKEQEEKEPESLKAEEKGSPAAEAKGEEKGEEKVDEGKTEGKKAEEPGKDEKPKTEKPPKGYVPTAALTEAREIIKALKEEVAGLKTQEPERKAPAKENPFKDFKVLSDAEYDELADEDPAEALRYMNKLRKYEKYESEQRREQAKATESKQRMEALISDYTEQIATEIPGIYDEESEVASEYAEFAEELGFDNPDYLNVMTDPRTLIVPHGDSQSYLLGPGVLSFLKLLKNAKEKTASVVDEKALRETIENELRPKIAEEELKKLTKKMKGAEESSYKSITDVPGSGGEVDVSSLQTWNEEDWAKLKRKDPAKARELLGG